MSDYSSVAPPQSQLNQSQAFAAALQRAKAIAAKIQPGSQQQSSGGIKRSFDEEGGPDAKKFSNQAETHPSSGMNNNGPQNMTQAIAQAAAVAARLAATAGNTIEEQIRFPDSMISFMTGRSGNDNLSHIQVESGCKIQMSNESDCICTIRGGRDSVTKAKEMIQQMASQNGNGMIEIVTSITIPPPGANGYPPYQEIMVPGPKVGLVIGKGGETIKQLQEKTGAKMVIIQDGPNQEAIEKPLRISGDPQKIEHAKSLVFDLIVEKEPQFRTGFTAGGEQAEVFVPKIAVGVVIGKGGDMIKKIQGETGCKLQFIQGKNDAPGDRRCIIQGTRQQVDAAKGKIEDLIESVMKSNPMTGGQMNRNTNQDNGNSAYGYGYGVNHTQQPQREEVTFSVPASKCGIVIGRGGETIKLINQQSGAYCEMDRAAVNPPSEKMFKCKGTAEQIETARQMISEKINVDIVILSRKPIGNTIPNHANNATAGYNNMQADNTAAAYQQQWGYQQGWDATQQAAMQMTTAAAAGGAPDYSQQWIEYYKSLGMTREAEMIEQQLKAKQAAGQNGAVNAAVAGMAAAQMMQSTAAAAAQAPAAAAAGGVQDYSQQWIEYYRRIGKIEEAEQIEKQVQAAKNAGGQPPNSNQAGNPSAGGAPPGGVPGGAAGAGNPNGPGNPGPGGPAPGAGPAGYPQGMAQYAQYSQYAQYAAAAAAAAGQGYPGYQGGYPAAGYPGGPQPPQPNQQNNQNDKN